MVNMIRIENRAQVQELIRNVKKNIEVTQLTIKQILDDDEPINSFMRIKFDKVAFDPVTGEKINFIEMLNQAYSDLVVLQATQDLLKNYPAKVFEINMGARSGLDICSTDSEVVAECFSVVTILNNQKVKKDSEKLMKYESSTKKYIYYYSREDSEEVIKRIMEKYPDIIFKRIMQF